jgi:hypothetical protein
MLIPLLGCVMALCKSFKEIKESYMGKDIYDKVISTIEVVALITIIVLALTGVIH